MARGLRGPLATEALDPPGQFNQKENKMPVPEAFQEYAKRLVLPGSDTLYRIFEILFDTEDKIKLMGALPGSVGELAERTGLPESQLQELTQSMFLQGAIARKDGLYRLFPALIELRDAAILWSDATPGDVRPVAHGFSPMKCPDLLKKVDTKQHSGWAPHHRDRGGHRVTRDTVLDIDSARKVFERGGGHHRGALRLPSPGQEGRRKP